MKIERNILWSLMVWSARATSDAAVYLFPAIPRTGLPSVPTLTPAEARLIFAQRLGISRYHSLERASGQTISYINEFGGSSSSLFERPAEDRPAELVLLIDGLSTEDAKPLLNLKSDTSATFGVSKAPAPKQNEILVADLNQQTGSLRTFCPLDQAINPFDQECWKGRTKILHVDVRSSAKNAPTHEELGLVLSRMLNFINKQEMNAMVAIMPTSSSSRSTYGSYDMPFQEVLSRRALTEEPMSGFNTEPSSLPGENTLLKASNNSNAPVRGVIPTCFSTLDACISSTNNCSSHGSCGRKFPSRNLDDHSTACFTCFCGNTTDVTEDGTTIFTEWGGAACQKRDVSAPFWLIATSSVVLVGLVSWAIGMLFSIGEEKLPGVIGAGVSSGKTR